MSNRHAVFCTNSNRDDMARVVAHARAYWMHCIELSWRKDGEFGTEDETPQLKGPRPLQNKKGGSDSTAQVEPSRPAVPASICLEERVIVSARHL